MAADNREFVNKFANEGGGDVLVEDKRLEELKSATAKTSSQISTTEQYIPLQDTDGNIVKINPASFEEAVRNVLGGLLANNDKGTTISGIPALSGSGQSLDFGSVTPANLASVLGVNSNIGIHVGQARPSQAFVLDINTHIGIVMSKWSYSTQTEIGINFVDGNGKYVTKIASPTTTFEPAISIDSSGRLIVSSQNGRYVDVKVLLL